MIKDVMVPLDGTAADEARLAAANHIAEEFNGQITGLFLNVCRSQLRRKMASARFEQRNCCRKRARPPTG